MQQQHPIHDSHVQLTFTLNRLQSRSTLDYIRHGPLGGPLCGNVEQIRIFAWFSQFFVQCTKISFRRGGGGMCILFKICEKRPFQKCMGCGGGGGGQVVAFWSSRAAKSACKHALKISHTFVPNRRLRCLFQAGLGPHLGRYHHAYCWEHIFSAFANPAACSFSLVPTLNSEALPRDHPLRGWHSVALSASPCPTHWTRYVPCFHPHKTRMRGKVALIRGGAKVQPLHLVVPNQNIGGCNSTWREFVCGHGGCLLTKGGSKQHRHRPKRTKISNMSSVQHGDPGCSK